MNPDRVVQFVLDRAKAEPKIEKVLLFGSRARGDAKDRSDYDLAFLAPKITEQEWARFVTKIEDEAPTLHHLDLLLLDPQTIRPELLSHILNEGVTLYDRNAIH